MRRPFSVKLSLVITVGTDDARKAWQSCLTRLNHQTLVRQIEIILVMPQSYTLKVNWWVQNHPLSFARLRVVGARGCAGFATLRNIGLRHTSAEWVSYYDTEERVADNYFERMLNTALQLHADAAICDMRYRDREMSEDCPLRANNLFFETLHGVVSCEPSTLEASAVLCSPDGASLYGKLLKRSCLSAFPFVCEIEDLYAGTVVPLLAETGAIAYIPGLFTELRRSRNYIQTHSAVTTRFAAAYDALQAFERIRNAPNSCRQIVATQIVLPALAAIICDGEAVADLIKMLDILTEAHHILPAELFGNRNPFLQKLWTNGTGWERKMSARLETFLYDDCFHPKVLLDMGEFQPIVTLVIPVYNGSNYLREAIDSALNQTYSKVEVIVVNDGSNDQGATEAIAKSYGDQIRYLDKQNGGVATALNEGIRQMTGEYFSWLSHDDVYAPYKIENQIRWLSFSDDPTLLVSEGFQVVDEYTQYRFTIDPLHQYPKQRLQNAYFAVTRWCINGCAILIHKSHFDRVGLFDPRYPTTQDYDLWNRMLLGQKLLMIGNIDMRSRSHSEQGRYTATLYQEECDHTLIRTMDAPDIAEMEKLDGTVYNYYRGIYCFIVSEAFCPRAAQHARAMAELADLQSAETAIWPELTCPPVEKESPSYVLYRSLSWRLTKTIRAWNYARSPRPDSKGFLYLFRLYMTHGEMDRQCDETISRSACWRITKPFRLFSEGKRKPN